LSKIGPRSAFKSTQGVEANYPSALNSAPDDWTRTYRKGQTMLHPTFGLG